MQSAGTFFSSALSSDKSSSNIVIIPKFRFFSVIFLSGELALGLPILVNFLSLLGNLFTLVVGLLISDSFFLVSDFALVTSNYNLLFSLGDRGEFLVGSIISIYTFYVD